MNTNSSRFFVGLDLGQSMDFTALAVLERVELAGEWDAVMFAHRKTAALRLRHLERTPLGTPYPEVVGRVRQVMRNGDLLGRSQLAVDATGVGRGVVDLLRRADLGCILRPVTITSGHGETMTNGYYGVPKRDLMVGLQILLQTRGLQIAAGIAEGPRLLKEMAEMRVRVTAAGREQYGNSREGEHDDLVLAVALACWGARRVYPNPPYGEESWCGRTDETTAARWLKKSLPIGV